MKRHVRYALGALSIAAGCALSAAPALSDQSYPNSIQPNRSNPHPSAPPSQGWSSGPHFPSGGAPHYQPGSSFQREPFYRPTPRMTERPWQAQHSYPQYGGEGTWQGGRESFGDRRYAPSPATQGYDRSRRNYPAYRGESSWQDRPNEGFSGRGYAPGSSVRGFDRGRSTALRQFASFRGRRFTELGEPERAEWRGGTWRHTWYHGRYGWWWYVDGGWFFYNTPIYPYPVYISDYAYDDYVDYGDYGYAGYGGYDTLYWCAWPEGYYPDVQVCMVDWQPVPAE